MYGENRYHQRFFLYVRKIKKNKNYCIKYCIIYTRVDYENLRENIKDYFKRNLFIIFHSVMYTY